MIRLDEIGAVMVNMERLTPRVPFKGLFDILAKNPAAELQAALSPITRQIEAVARLGEQIDAFRSAADVPSWSAS
jgi:hypothetical protein